MRRWVMLCAAGLLLGATVAAAQEPPLQAAAAGVRAAWLAHDVGGVVASGPEILVQLPGADPAPAVGRAQAAALLRNFLAGGKDVEVTVRSARQIQPGVGYVELLRRFRVTGTQELRSQRVLLGYRLTGARWELAELRVVE